MLVLFAEISSIMRASSSESMLCASGVEIFQPSVGQYFGSGISTDTDFDVAQPATNRIKSRDK